MLPIDSSTSRIQQVQDTHLNAEGLESLKAMGRARDPEALREVAKKFESIFVHQMLKNMRAANAVFSEDNFLSSNETQFHQEMLDQQMSLELTNGRGFGLADAFYRQMMEAYGSYLPEQDPEQQTVANPFAVEFKYSGQKPSLEGVEKSSVIGGKAGASESPEAFMAALKPYAERAAAELNIKPDVLLAQVALETGWGKHVIHAEDGSNSHNLFNIKADQRWQGERIQVSTLEYRQGVAQQERADFRRYDNYAQSFSDYVEFVKTSPRYQQALEAGTDSAAYAQELQNAGYATDPDYANKIKQLLNADPVRMALEENSLAGTQPDEA